MKNKYRVENELVYMELKNRNGLVLETIFDRKHLKKIQDLNVSWHLKWDKKTKSYYVKASTTYFDSENKRRQTTTHLHREIMEVKDSLLYVDHINHDTLDNRDCNMRITNKQKNSSNRAKANTNNSSGYRNITWNKRSNMWEVQLQVNGKNTRVGSFEKDELIKANEFAIRMRKQIYGEYSGQ